MIGASGGTGVSPVSEGTHQGDTGETPVPPDPAITDSATGHGRVAHR